MNLELQIFDMKVQDESLKLLSRSVEDTQGIGREMGRMAERGDLYLLVGNLGAGKTCLAQGIAWGLGIKGFISSPSFVILREYRGRLPLYHVDLYRMQKVQEIGELGLEDYLYGDGACVVEWANRGWNYPGDFLFIEMEILSEKERLICCVPEGKRYYKIIKELREAFSHLIPAANLGQQARGNSH